MICLGAKMNLTNLSISELHNAYRNRDVTCREVVIQYFNNIKTSKLNSYIYLDENKALEDAEIFDEKIKKNESISLLGGIPIAVKDNIAFKGERMTCASKFFYNYIPNRNSTVADKLKDSGGIVLGKANMDEFAMGSSTRTSYFGPSLNPLDESLVPGGSSGGSAVAVAADEALVALGTDTGGSTRQPAAFCGLVGYKPSYGTISKHGIMSMAESLDTVGTLGKNVMDAYTLALALSGKDYKDIASVENSSIKDISNIELKDLKLGLIKEYREFELEDEVKKDFTDTIELLKEEGVQFYEFSVKSILDTVNTYNILSNTEVYWHFSELNHKEFAYKIPEKNLLDQEVEYLIYKNAFGDEVQKRIKYGYDLVHSEDMSELYNNAILNKKKMSCEFNEVFKICHGIISPASPSLPFKIDATDTNYDADIFTIPANLTGCPSISIPGLSSGFPKSILLTSKLYKDNDCLGTARVIEELMAK